jgi:hypothetical protein
MTVPAGEITPVGAVPPPTPSCVPAVPVTDEVLTVLVIAELASTPYVDAVPRVNGASTALAVPDNRVTPSVITDPRIAILLTCNAIFLFLIMCIPILEHVRMPDGFLKRR